MRQAAISLAECADTEQRPGRGSAAAGRSRAYTRRSRRIGATALALSALLSVAGCRSESEAELALRILDRYRQASGARPLAASQVIRMRLTPGNAASISAVGEAEVAWRRGRYRERVTSGGASTERGIQGGKAYYVDEDGFTRVASEPVLAELLARSYFWRRAWLFEDRERARIALGPADARNVSIRITPSGGSHPLTLSFSRRDGQLAAVRSPRFDLDFTGPTRFREASGRRPPVEAEITSVDLPTGPLPDSTVGGGCGTFAAAPTPVTFEPTPDGGLTVPASVNGVPVRLALDAAVDGPLRVSPALAERLGLPFSSDVFGRSIGSGGRLDLGGFSCETIHLEATPDLPDGADASAGGTLFREAVVEIDPVKSLLTLHDSSRWVQPEAFTRVLVDDDQNRPVTILRRSGEDVRVRVPSPIRGGAHLRLAPEAAGRAGVEPPATVDGFRWGGVALPGLSVVSETGPSSPAWGDDGALGFPLLLRFHSYLDLTYRWLYLRPVDR